MSAEFEFMSTQALFAAQDVRIKYIRLCIQTALASGTDAEREVLRLVRSEADWAIAQYAKLLAAKEPLTSDLEAAVGDLHARSWRGQATNDQLRMVLHQAIKHGESKAMHGTQKTTNPTEVPTSD